MENGKKGTVYRKKRVLTAVTGIVCVCCALAAGVFFANQRLKEKKRTKEQEIAKEREQAAEKRKEKKGPWTDYTVFIEDVKKGVEDDFCSVSAQELEISPVFGKKEVNTQTHILGYYLEDLDSDGVDELFFGSMNKSNGTTAIYDIYTMKDGVVFHAASGDNELHNSFCLYENGTVGHENFDFAAKSGKWDGYHAYYTWKEGSLQLVEAIIHKEEKVFYSKEGVTAENPEEVSWEEISKELQEKGYKTKDIIFTPFIETDDSSDYADNENLAYSDLEKKEFWFYSGAGAWKTSLEIHGDGTFTGIYEDADVGTLYKCNFSGRFTDLRKTGPYEYTMKCTDLKLEREPGTKEVVKECRICYSDPYGFDDTEEFKVYLPGKKVNELPGAFLGWSHGEAADGYLQCYGIYNEGGHEGFVEMDLNED